MSQPAGYPTPEQRAALSAYGDHLEVRIFSGDLYLRTKPRAHVQRIDPDGIAHAEPSSAWPPRGVTLAEAATSAEVISATLATVESNQ